MQDFDFREWLAAVGLTKVQAATELGVTANYVSMLAAHSRSMRRKQPSPALVQRCREIAQSRMDGLARYAVDRQGGVSSSCQHEPGRAYIRLFATGYATRDPAS
jgi:hypothetical protein